jgi:hypothetical protein
MLGRNVQISFFIWMVENVPRADKSAMGAINRPLRIIGMVDNPARVDKSAPTDECIALGVARLVDNSQILPLLLSQTV